MKMKGKSPLMKELVGKQHNLNEGLKAAIKAAPGKMMQKSPMNMKEETAIKMGMASPMKLAGMSDPERAKLMASLNAAKAQNPELYSDKNREIMEKAGENQPVMTSPDDAPTPKEFKKLRKSKPQTRKEEKVISLKPKEADFKAETKAPEIKRVADSDKPETRVMSKQEKKDLRQAKRSRARRGFAKGFREGFVSEMTGDKVADIRKRAEERKTKREEEKKSNKEALIAAASKT